MTASSIEVPTTTTSELATDEVDGRHFQGVKVHGGGEGVVNELAVLDRGELRRPAVELLRGQAFLSGLVESTSYNAGDVVGSATEVAGIPVGVYALRYLVAAVSGSGEPLPDDVVVYLIAHDPASPPDYGDDGDPFTPNDARFFVAQPCPLTIEVASFAALGAFRPAYDVLVNGVPLDAAGDRAAGDVFDLQVAVVTNGGGAAIDTATGIAVQMLLERVGPEAEDL
jgi:hypothetical protein